MLIAVKDLGGVIFAVPLPEIRSAVDVRPTPPINNKPIKITNNKQENEKTSTFIMLGGIPVF